MILVFDLDDTLYDELTYVQSGFSEVANYLSDILNVKPQRLITFLSDELKKNGRGKIFDNILKYYNIYSKVNVTNCLKTYRLHAPKITLNADAMACFKRVSNSKYIVTDGHKIVQRNKIRALCVESYVKKVFITHNYGLKNSKPSPYCFLKIAKMEKQKNENIVYVGDNPHKDFVGLKPLGFKTVRINQGMFKNVILDKKHEAHLTINSLDMLDQNLLSSLKCL